MLKNLKFLELFSNLVDFQNGFGLQVLSFTIHEFSLYR